MAAKRQPTNADLLKEFREMSGRLQSIEQWRISVDAGKAAVDEYKREEGYGRRGSGRLNAELVKNIGIALTIILALLSALLASKGHGGL